MTVDMSKIKVGDEVTIRLTVTHTWDDRPTHVQGTSGNNDKWSVRAEDVITHTPKPREIKVGDVVKWECSGKLYQNAKVIAIHENSAWVLGDKRGEGLTTLLMEHLAHA